MTEKKEFLSIPEAAALMGISRIAVFKKVKKGQLAAIRIGRNWAVPTAAFENPSPAAPLSRISASHTPRPAPRPPVPEEPVLEKDPLDDMGWD